MQSGILGCETRAERVMTDGIKPPQDSVCFLRFLGAVATVEQRRAGNRLLFSRH